jgi:hypothetical protein
VPRWRVGIGAGHAISASSIDTACKRTCRGVFCRVGQNSEGLSGGVESEQGGVSIGWRYRKSLCREMSRRRDRCTSVDARTSTGRDGACTGTFNACSSTIATSHEVYG